MPSRPIVESGKCVWLTSLWIWPSKISVKFMSTWARWLRGKPHQIYHFHQNEGTLGRLIWIVAESICFALAFITFIGFLNLLCRLSHVPENLIELVESIDLLEKVLNERTEIEDKFLPLEGQFAILDNFEVTYKNEVATRRVNLVSDWTIFKETLVNCEEASRLRI